MSLRRGGFAVFISGVSVGAQDPTFQTGAELVQVSVVAQDKQRKPVEDLRREEFQILDNGSPQRASNYVLLPEPEKSSPAAKEPEAPNTFTNRIAAPAGSHSWVFGDSDRQSFHRLWRPFHGPGSANARYMRAGRCGPLRRAKGSRFMVWDGSFRSSANSRRIGELLEPPAPEMDAKGRHARNKRWHSSSPTGVERRRSRRSRAADGLQRASASDDEMELVADSSGRVFPDARTPTLALQSFL